MTGTFISDEELDTLATQLLAEYERAEGTVIVPPVPIDLVIENLLDITIDWTEIASPDPNSRVLARIRQTVTGRTIEMNSLERPFFDQYFGTIAFSKAHEVGHAILHLPEQSATQTQLLSKRGEPIFCRSDRHNRVEIQAERFAACILMPEHLVHAAVADKSINGWPQIYRLRDTFGVSVSAMRHRLERLNLLYIDPAGHVYPSREAASGQRSLW